MSSNIKKVLSIKLRKRMFVTTTEQTPCSCLHVIKLVIRFSSTLPLQKHFFFSWNLVDGNKLIMFYIVFVCFVFFCFPLLYFIFSTNKSNQLSVIH